MYSTVHVLNHKYLFKILLIIIDCGIKMIADILHRTAVCGLVGVTIYGLFLVGKGAVRMESARRNARSLQAEDTSKVVIVDLEVLL